MHSVNFLGPFFLNDNCAPRRGVGRGGGGGGEGEAEKKEVNVMWNP